MSDIEGIILQVKQAVVEILELDIQPDELPDDESLMGGLGTNSVTTLKIVIALEEKFGIEVEDDEFSTEKFSTIQSLAKYISEKIGITSHAKD